MQIINPVLFKPHLSPGEAFSCLHHKGNARQAGRLQATGYAIRARGKLIRARLRYRLQARARARLRYRIRAMAGRKDQPEGYKAIGKPEGQGYRARLPADQGKATGYRARLPATGQGYAIRARQGQGRGRDRSGRRGCGGDAEG